MFYAGVAVLLLMLLLLPTALLLFLLSLMHLSHLSLAHCPMIVIYIWLHDFTRSYSIQLKLPLFTILSGVGAAVQWLPHQGPGSWKWLM